MSNIDDALDALDDDSSSHACAHEAALDQISCGSNSSAAHNAHFEDALDAMSDASCSSRAASPDGALAVAQESEPADELQIVPVSSQLVF